jgi:hypothetical protein
VGFPLPQQRLAPRARTEPVADLRGTVLGHGILIVGNATAFAVQQPEVHGGLRSPLNSKRNEAFFGANFTG